MKDQTHDQFGTVVGLSTRAALREVTTTSQAGMSGTAVFVEKITYRGSSTPHHTPMPATDPGFPFPEHAPSVYTSSAIADVPDGPAAACDLILGESEAVL
jgi:hypothetical protein